MFFYFREQISFQSVNKSGESCQLHFMKKIIVIGGGFAGVQFAELLAAKSTDYQITLLDRNNYNFFPPLLYQVATGFLDVSNICYPYRRLLYKFQQISFRQGNLESIDLTHKLIKSSTGTLSYDYLVIATGAETNYFGMEQVRKNAIPMKTVDDAIALRNHFLGQYEAATREPDREIRKKRLTFVVAGGGPTGVEISGMMATLKKEVVPKEYREIPQVMEDTRIILVDGQKAPLSPMSISAQLETKRVLENMGVQLLLERTIKDYQNETATLSDGSTIGTYTLIWAAGVTGTRFAGLPDSAFGRGNRLQVDAYNQLKGIDSVYAIGDTCLLTDDPAFPNGHPQVAQVAIQQAKQLAENFALMAKQQPFRYKDKGSMAIIGRNKAVADLTFPKWHLKGFFAWMAWLFVHLFSLIRFNNKIKTLYNWTIAYITRNTSMRLIIGKTANNPELSASSSKDL